MFTPEERSGLRLRLLELAACDERISAGAMTGSAAAEREDKWSDIDLAFAVNETAEVPKVLEDWTNHMYSEHQALHHMDVRAGAWTYRVFLLANTLQVDLAFVAANEFRALSPTFKIVFGEAKEARHAPAPIASDLVGLAWLYALHARSSIARRKLWQAEYMISGVRDHALALACVRHGVPAVQGRGIDQLPSATTMPFEESLVRPLNVDELSRAFEVAVQALLGEIRAVDADLAGRLQPALEVLVETTRREPFLS